MKLMRIIFVIPLLALPACTMAPYDYSSSQRADGNHELTLTGYPSVSQRELKAYMKERAEAICGWPYLIRHTKSEEFLVSGAPVATRATPVHHYGLYAEIECGAGGSSATVTKN